MSLARDTNSRKYSQIEKRDRNEIITVAKILLTNQIVIIVDCDFSSIVFIVYTQRRRFRLNSLKFFRMIVFWCQIDNFVWFSQVCGQAFSFNISQNGFHFGEIVAESCINVVFPTHFQFTFIII